MNLLAFLLDSSNAINPCIMKNHLVIMASAHFLASLQIPIHGCKGIHGVFATVALEEQGSCCSIRRFTLLLNL